MLKPGPTLKVSALFACAQTPICAICRHTNTRWPDHLHLTHASQHILHNADRLLCHPTPPHQYPCRNVALYMPGVQAIETARGCLYLHSRNLVHRDLRSPNLLISQSWQIKVGTVLCVAGLCTEGPSMLIVSPAVTTSYNI